MWRFNSKDASKPLILLLLLICSVVAHLSAISWTAARQAYLSFTISWNLLKLMSIESVILSNHLILYHLLLLLPAVFPSIRVFSNFISYKYTVKWFTWGMVFKAALLWQSITKMFKTELKVLYLKYLLCNRHRMYMVFGLPSTFRKVAFWR